MQIGVLLEDLHSANIFCKLYATTRERNMIQRTRLTNIQRHIEFLKRGMNMIVTGTFLWDGDRVNGLQLVTPKGTRTIDSTGLTGDWNVVRRNITETVDPIKCFPEYVVPSGSENE